MINTLLLLFGYLITLPLSALLTVSPNEERSAFYSYPTCQLSVNTNGVMRQPIMDSKDIGSTVNNWVLTFDRRELTRLSLPAQNLLFEIPDIASSEYLYFINEDEWIKYTIRFQNTGTFYAEFEVITDTVAPELDLSTFEQGVSSHPFTAAFKPGRVIEWRFDDILLPDSTTDEPDSHGLVEFRVRPQGLLMPGTTIENTANIYFDFNPPVITEPSVLVAGSSTGVIERHRDRMLLYPNPAGDHVRVSWPQGTPISAPWALIAPDGRIVLNGRTTAADETINIGSAATGTYLLRLVSNERVSTITLLRSTHP